MGSEVKKDCLCDDWAEVVKGERKEWRREEKGRRNGRWKGARKCEWRKTAAVTTERRSCSERKESRREKEEGGGTFHTWRLTVNT